MPTGECERDTHFFYRGFKLMAVRKGAFKAHFHTQPGLTFDLDSVTDKLATGSEDIARNADSRFFVKTMLDFIHGFGLKSVAEFVENGRAVLEIICAAYESARTGQRVKLPLESSANLPVDYWLKKPDRPPRIEARRDAFGEAGEGRLHRSVVALGADLVEDRVARAVEVRDPLEPRRAGVAVDLLPDMVLHRRRPAVRLHAVGHESSQHTADVLVVAYAKLGDVRRNDGPTGGHTNVGRRRHDAGHQDQHQLRRERHDALDVFAALSDHRLGGARAGANA